MLQQDRRLLDQILKVIPQSKQDITRRHGHKSGFNITFIQNVARCDGQLHLSEVIEDGEIENIEIVSIVSFPVFIYNILTQIFEETRAQSGSDLVSQSI
jgi:hypothetical protein